MGRLGADGWLWVGARVCCGRSLEPSTEAPNFSTASSLCTLPGWHVAFSGFNVSSAPAGGSWGVRRPVQPESTMRPFEFHAELLDFPNAVLDALSDHGFA